MTNIIRATGYSKHFSNFHRFFSRSSWSLEGVCRILGQKIIKHFLPDGLIEIAGDDTTCHKTGRKIAYAGISRDAAGSSHIRAVLHWAHNRVGLGIIVPAVVVCEVEDLFARHLQTLQERKRL